MGEPVPVLLMSRSIGHGGGERQLAMVALSLDRSRFVPYVAAAEAGFWTEPLEQRGVQLHTIRSRGLLTRRGVSEMRRLRQWIVSQRIRIVQTFDYASNVYGVPVARSVRGVIALSNLRCHMNLIPPRDRRLNYFSHRLASAVVVNSEALRRHLMADYGIASGKIHVCYNGLDTATFRSAPRESSAGRDLLIGIVSVLRPEKNIPLLLDAFSVIAARRSGVRLLIVGSGPEEEHLRAQAARLRIDERCVFQPSTRDVVPHLRTIDIFVLPSLTEGLSNSVMEAMACGCCVIATDVGGTGELIENGVSGLLFPSGDREALIGAIERVLDDPARRAALAASGAARMQQRFSLAASVQCMQEVYEKLLSRCA